MLSYKIRGARDYQRSRTETVRCSISYAYLKCYYLYSVTQKKSLLRFPNIFPKRLGIFSPNFARLLHVRMYARIQIFVSIICNFDEVMPC